MANNKFDIKVFTDELNKAFTILKKEQVLEKYMKNVLLNYNSIIYIGNITDELNKYNTIYNYMYGEDNTLCNIVIFETDGFVDSESNIIPSGIHIAYPYLDYDVCIDYEYILNINNSAELLTPTQEYKTINNESILGNGNIAVQEPLVSGTNIKTVNGQTILGSGNVPVQEPLVSGTNIKTVNEQSLVGSGNIAVQEPLVSGTNIKTINNASLLGSGNIYVQEKLVSGSNIKTVNGQSLVGSGNVTVQEPLVSGRNIKAVNEQSLVGGGSIYVQEKLVSGINIKTVNGQTLLGNGNIEISGGGGSDGLTFPTTSPTSQLIPSITTSNTQQNLTIGDGLEIKNGALQTKEVESTEFVCANYGFQSSRYSIDGKDIGAGIGTDNTDVINKATQFINILSNKESFSKHKCSISIEIDSLGIYAEVTNLYPVKNGDTTRIYTMMYFLGNVFAEIYINSLNKFHIDFTFVDPIESKVTQLNQMMEALATNGKITFNILEL